MERFSFVFLVAGLGCFVLAFVVSAWFPMLPVQGMDVRTVEQMSRQQPLEFLELREQYPEAIVFMGFDESDKLRFPVADEEFAPVSGWRVASTRCALTTTVSPGANTVFGTNSVCLSLPLPVVTSSPVTRLRTIAP